MERKATSTLSGSFAHFAAVLALVVAVFSLPGLAQPANTILLETWTGITGQAVTNLTSNANYPNTPGTRTYPTLYEQPTTTATDLGTRTRAFITPPTTGVYNFYIACDDACELWLSTDDNAVGRALIASSTLWTNSREWAKYASQKSANITLTAGERYYIETLHKQGGGGGNVAVGWQGPGITADAERPIPGSRLMPFQLIAAPAVTTQPGNKTVTEGQTATFTVVASGTGLTYQWRKNGVNIVGATSATYTTPATVSSDNGAIFTVKIRNAGGSATSSNSVLTVNPALVAPTITTPAGNPFSVSATVGTAYSYTVVATGTGTTSMSYTATGLPAGLSINATTGVISGTPTTAGTPSATITASNGVSPAATRTFNFTVSTVAPPPVITTQPVSASAVVGATANFTVAVSGTSLTYQWKKNGANVPSGGTAATYTTPAVTLADDGAVYTCTVTSGGGPSVTTNGASKLLVEFHSGKLSADDVVALRISASEVVTTPQWEIPDYVFEKGYNLKTLADLEQYVATHKHLPEMPSAKDIRARGMNLSEMNVQLLKNVEELTLRLITLQKEMKDKDARLQQELEAVRSKLGNR
jgi:hypothetical protein